MIQNIKFNNYFKSWRPLTHSKTDIKQEHTSNDVAMKYKSWQKSPDKIFKAAVSKFVSNVQLQPQLVFLKYIQPPDVSKPAIKLKDSFWLAKEILSDFITTVSYG